MGSALRAGCAHALTSAAVCVRFVAHVTVALAVPMPVRLRGLASVIKCGGSTNCFLAEQGLEARGV